MTVVTITEAEAGCYLDSHRGHYAIRDMIELAVEYGYIVGPFERYALDRYDDEHSSEDYPHEGLFELTDDALEWLNSGQGDRVAGQNFPPIVPDGYAWDWSDGDFGLYALEEES